MGEPDKLSDLHAALLNRFLHEIWLVKQEVRAVGNVGTISKKNWNVIRETAIPCFDGIYVKVLQDEATGYVDVFIFKYPWAMELFEQLDKLQCSDLITDSIRGMMYGYSLLEISRFVEKKRGHGEGVKETANKVNQLPDGSIRVVSKPKEEIKKGETDA